MTRSQTSRDGGRSRRLHASTLGRDPLCVKLNFNRLRQPVAPTTPRVGVMVLACHNSPTKAKVNFVFTRVVIGAVRCLPTLPLYHAINAERSHGHLPRSVWPEIPVCKYGLPSVRPLTRRAIGNSGMLRHKPIGRFSLRQPPETCHLTASDSVSKSGL
jgi:hypothetical protein